MDNLTKAQRRMDMMQNIRSMGIKPGRTVMEALRRRKMYFASYNLSAQRADIIFCRKRVAIFIDCDF